MPNVALLRTTVSNHRRSCARFLCPCASTFPSVNNRIAGLYHPQVRLCSFPTFIQCATCKTQCSRATVKIYPPQMTPEFRGLDLRTCIAFLDSGLKSSLGLLPYLRHQYQILLRFCHIQGSTLRLHKLHEQWPRSIPKRLPRESSRFFAVEKDDGIWPAMLLCREDLEIWVADFQQREELRRAEHLLKHL